MVIFLPQRRYHHNLGSKDGLTNWLEIVTILGHYQPSYNTSHTMKPSDPLLLADVTLHCGMKAKLTYLDTQPSPGSPRVRILLASPVWMLVNCVVKPSRPPDLKSSSNISFPFVWITVPRKRTQLSCYCMIVQQYYERTEVDDLSLRDTFACALQQFLPECINKTADHKALFIRLFANRK